MRIRTLLPGLLALAFMATVPANAQTDHLGSFNTAPAHPRILLLKGEESKIKATISGDQTWSRLHQAILNESDIIVKAAPIERIQIGRRLLDKSRKPSAGSSSSRMPIASRSNLCINKEPKRKCSPSRPSPIGTPPTSST